MSALKQTARKLIEKTPVLDHWFKRFYYQRANTRFPVSFAPEYNDILQSIQKDGFYVLPDYVAPEVCDACRTAIDDVIENHPDYVRVREDKRIFGAQYVCDELQAIYDDPYLQSLSDAYYGDTTEIGVMLVNRLEPNDMNLGSGGDWHRDRLQRQFKAIVYLDDVSPENGPFEVIKGSNMHHFDTFKNDLKTMQTKEISPRYNHAQVSRIIDKNPERLVTFTATKGTVILVDTSAIHRGSPIRSGLRYASFNYYYPSHDINHAALAKKFSPQLHAGFKDNKK